MLKYIYKYYQEVYMTKEFIENWLENLKIHWLNKDINNIINIFKNTTYYQESPFIKPYTNINEIEKEWLSIKNINIQELTLKVLSINNNIAIINWHLLQDNKEYDGIYEIKFNEKLECIYFKSWCEENDS